MLVLLLLLFSSAHAGCNDLTYQNGTLLSKADHDRVDPIYGLGYTDALFSLIRGETARTQARVRTIYNNAIYEDLRAMNNGGRGTMLPVRKTPMGLRPPTRDPDDYEYNFIRYHVTRTGNLYQRLDMVHTITHETRSVDLTQVAPLQSLSSRFAPILLSADSAMKRFLFAIYDKVGSTDTRFYALDTQTLQTKYVYICMDCFYLLRWYGNSVGGWLQNKNEFWILTDYSQRTPAHFVRMQFSDKDNSLDAVVTIHNVYRDHQSFSSFDHGLFTDDFHFILVGSVSRAGNFNNIYSARDGKLLHAGVPTVPNRIGQDYVKYMGNDTFLRIRSPDLRNFQLTMLHCDPAKCMESPVDSGARLAFLGMVEPLTLSYDVQVFDGKLVTPIYRGLRPEIVLYDLQTHAASSVRPPMDTDVSISGYDPHTHQAAVYGGNLVLETLQSIVDLRTGALVRTSNLSPHPFSGYTTKRLSVASADGTRVPVTLLIPSQTVPSPRTPLMVYGYGEYGTPAIASWMSREHVAPLLRRGFIVAFAHIRGGGDLGEAWRLGGTQARKVRGIEDFEAVLAGLHRMGISNPDRTAIKGFSAGGTIVTSVLARHPELFKIAFDEWGVADAMNFVLDNKSFLAGRERMLPIGDPLRSNEFGFVCARSGLQLLDKIPARNIVWVTTTEDDLQVPPWIPAGYFAKVRQLTTQSYFYSLQSGSHLGSGTPEEGWQHLTAEYSLMEKEFGLAR